MPAPKSGNGAAVFDMSKINFNFSNDKAKNIFGGGPSPKPEIIIPTGLSLPEPAPVEGNSGESSAASGDHQQPEAANPTPAEGSPAKPASPTGEQPEAPEAPSA